MSLFSYRNVVPFVVFCLFFSISVVLWQNTKKHGKELLHYHTETAGGQIKIRIEGLMNARMASLQLLADRWVERTPPDFSSERFYQFADSFYTYYPGFFSINWINPEGLLEWVFPERDELKRGSTIFDLDGSRYGETFRQVRQNLVIGTTPCSVLENMDAVFHVFLPLIYNHEMQGCIDGVFKLSEIMGVALAKDIREGFRIRVHEGDKLVYANGDPVEKGPHKDTPHANRTIQFPGKIWRLTLEPRGSALAISSRNNLSFLSFGFAISTALSLILYFLIQRMQLYREARDQALREISERKKAEDTLRKKETELETLLSEIEAKNEELETFVYTVSHDLKTPIVTIEGFIGAFREDFGDQITEDGDAYLNFISDATLKMETLINDLLELSRIGRLPETPAEFSFRDLVEEILANMHPLIQEKGIEVHVAKNLPDMWAEKKRITQVMENLISNAIKYLGSDNPSPRIDVGVREKNGRRVFFVQDNGIGVDPKYFEKIFQVFQRLPQARTINEGTGIGLTTAQRIIEHHGGKIWLDSKPRKGTTFFFTIPDREA